MKADKPLKAILSKLFEQYNLEESLKAEEVQAIWKSVVGDFIYNYTLDLQVRKNILYVKLKSPEIRNELIFAKTKLLQNLNHVLGERYLEDIRLE